MLTLGKQDNNNQELQVVNLLVSINNLPLHMIHMLPPKHSLKTQQLILSLPQLHSHLVVPLILSLRQPLSHPQVLPLIHTPHNLLIHKELVPTKVKISRRHKKETGHTMITSRINI